MRLRRVVRAVGTSLSVGLALWTGSAYGQFREVTPDGQTPRVARRDMAPTRQQFVQPKMRPTPQGTAHDPQPTPATPPPAVAFDPQRGVTPTPAPRLQPIPQPSAPARSIVAAPNPTVAPIVNGPLGQQGGAPVTASPRPLGGNVPVVVAPPTASAISPSPLPAPSAAPATTSEQPAAVVARVPQQALGGPAIATPVASPASPEPDLGQTPSPALPAVGTPIVPPATPIATAPQAPSVAPLNAPPAAVNPFAQFHTTEASLPGTLPSAPQPGLTTSPMAFNQIIAGTSSVAQLTNTWGQPALRQPDGKEQLLVYQAPGFRQIDVRTQRDGMQVSSILVHLDQPVPAATVAEQLALKDIRAVTVHDETGNSLGRAYPERGVLLVWADSNEYVTHIQVEAIQGEVFRMRAEADRSNQCTQQLADLDQAIRLNPDDAHAHWLRAELLSLIGRADDARTSSAQAIRLAPQHALYKLTHARLTAESGQLVDALTATRAVAESTDTPVVVRARAEYQWGNLTAIGPDPNFQDAMNHHLKAVDLAAAHISDPHPDVRRMAKDILVDTHLAIAQDIALGNFQRQREVVPKWLSRGTELTEDLITKEQGDPTTRMEVYRTTLAVYSILEGNFDASIATEEAIREGQRLVAEVSDRAYQIRVERELSEALYHAAKIEHRCGRATSAMQYISNAVVLADAGQSERQPSLFDRVMNGQLYYFAGSLHAINDEDHQEAVRWYEKSMPAFDDSRLVDLVDASAFGDLFVSMGVSYWEVGQKQKAIDLTQAGSELMQQGIQAGTLPMSLLAVPYANLAAMHQQMGNSDKAKHFATMLAKVEAEDKQPTRR